MSPTLVPDAKDMVNLSLNHLPETPSPTPTTLPHSPPLNPPPFPIIPVDCAADMLVDNLINDIARQLTKQLTHDVSILEANNTISGLSLINDTLLKSANQHNHTFIFNEFYRDFTAQSPVHWGIDQVSAAWIILHRGMLGRAHLSGREELGSGSFVPFLIHRLPCIALALSSRYCTLSWADHFIMNVDITFLDPPLISML